MEFASYTLRIHLRINFSMYAQYTIYAQMYAQTKWCFECDNHVYL